MKESLAPRNNVSIEELIVAQRAKNLPSSFLLSRLHDINERILGKWVSGLPFVRMFLRICGCSRS